MTLLYGKATNGTYYPVQVDETGQIIAIYAQDALVRPDLTAEFKSVILDHFARIEAPGLCYFRQGKFDPRLASANFEGTSIVPGTVTYVGRGGVYQVVGNKLTFSLNVWTSSVSGLTGQAILIDGIPKPPGYTSGFNYFSMSIEYWVGYSWGRAYPMVIQGWLAPGANGFGFLPSVLTPTGAAPEYLTPSSISPTENILYMSGEIWLP